MSAPGETAPATLPADWQAMAERTGRPYDQGGAYASDMFADWRGCVAVLRGYGFTLRGAVDFLRSKHMRWCADESSEGYGGATVAELTEYLGPDSSHWRSDFDMAPESVTASGEAAGPDAAADVSGDTMASLAHVAALRADAERERDAAIAQAKVAEARASAAERECDRLRDRERSIIDACERVADGGQYRADIIGAIERIREDRDAAITRAEKAEAEREAEHRHKLEVIAAFKLLGVQRMHAKAAWGDWRDCDQSEKAARYDAAEAAEQRVKAAESRLRAIGVDP